MADGSRFFDDIATHLPALLYEPERFTTVQEVLRYVQRQARQHMNRFDSGSAAYRGRGRRHGRGHGRRVANSGEELLRAMMGGLGHMTVISAELSTEDMTPVIVRPSRQQIDTATELISPNSATSGEQCAICQEALAATTGQLRRIRHCGHDFHQSCIDVWFTGNVRCPVCRHDIRE